MRVRNLLSRIFGGPESKAPLEQDRMNLGNVRVAACALFLEMARADGEFNDSERSRILGILKKDYDLSDEDAQTLLKATDQELEQSIDVWQFTKRINQDYSHEQKMELIHMLWEIVYADGTLDKHERYLVHKLSRLLRLRHDELIEAKLRVIRAKGSSAPS